MKKDYIKPDAEYIVLVAQEQITNDDLEGVFGDESNPFD